MTKFVDPQLKQHIPATDISDANLVSKKQVEEIIEFDPTIIASVMKISGSYKTAFAMIGDTLFGWGDSNVNYRMFGFADDIITQPTRISNFEAIDANVVDISCGKYHALVLLSNGEVWGSGGDSFGQLGLSSITNTTYNWHRLDGPWAALNAVEVLKVYAVADRSFVLIKYFETSDSTFRYYLYATGENSNYQIGNGGNIDIAEWELVYNLITSATDANITSDQIHFAGNYFSQMLWVDNDLNGLGAQIFVTGINDSGQLGLGNTTSPVTSFTSYTFDEIPGYPGVKPVRIMMSDRSAVCLGDDDYLYMVGRNSNDVYAIGNTSDQPSWIQLSQFSNIKDFAVADWDSNPAGSGTGLIAVTITGELKVSGNGVNGQLGIEETGYTTSPVTMDNNRIQGTKFIAVWAVGYTRFAIDVSGNLWSWGYNDSMQAGLGFDSATDDDAIYTPQTVAFVNNARLSLTFRNLLRNYSHPVIPQIVEQTVVQSGSGEYIYKAIDGHSTLGITQELYNGASSPAYDYPMSGFIGTDLDTTKIRKIYVKIEALNGATFGADSGNSKVYITYPDGTEHKVFDFDPQINSSLDMTLSDIVEVPIAKDQDNFIIRLENNNHGGQTDYIRTTIVGCEEYLSSSNAGRTWAVVEEQTQGTPGTTLTADQWNIIPFNANLGVKNIAGASLLNNEFTLPEGSFKGHFFFNPVGNAVDDDGIWGSLRIYNVTTGQELQKLPNVYPAWIPDSGGNPQPIGNGISVPFELNFTGETTIRFECYPNKDMITGHPNDKVATGKEQYSRVHLTGYEVESVAIGSAGVKASGRHIQPFTASTDGLEAVEATGDVGTGEGDIHAGAPTTPYWTFIDLKDYGFDINGAPIHFVATSNDSDYDTSHTGDWANNECEFYQDPTDPTIWHVKSTYTHYPDDSRTDFRWYAAQDESAIFTGEFTPAVTAKARFDVNDIAAASSSGSKSFRDAKNISSIVGTTYSNRTVYRVEFTNPLGITNYFVTCQVFTRDGGSLADGAEISILPDTKTTTHFDLQVAERDVNVQDIEIEFLVIDPAKLGVIDAPVGSWDYDSGWIADFGALNDQTFNHNLDTDVFSSIVIQMRDVNEVPIQFNGSAIAENRVAGEYNRGYGPRVTMPDRNNIVLDCPIYGGQARWLPDHTDSPPGWSGTQPSELRILLKR